MEVGTIKEKARLEVTGSNSRSAHMIVTVFLEICKDFCCTNLILGISSAFMDSMPVQVAGGTFSTSHWRDEWPRLARKSCTRLGEEL